MERKRGEMARAKHHAATDGMEHDGYGGGPKRPVLLPQGRIHLAQAMLGELVLVPQSYGEGEVLPRVAQLLSTPCAVRLHVR